MGKLIVPVVDSKETSGAKTDSAAGRRRSRNNLGSEGHDGEVGGGGGRGYEQDDYQGEEEVVIKM